MSDISLDAAMVRAPQNITDKKMIARRDAMDEPQRLGEQLWRAAGGRMTNPGGPGSPEIAAMLMMGGSMGAAGGGGGNGLFSKLSGNGSGWQKYAKLAQSGFDLGGGGFQPQQRTPYQSPAPQAPLISPGVGISMRRTAPSKQRLMAEAMMRRV
jgi:hypothetical protein